MAKENVTNKELLNYYEEITSWKVNKSIRAKFDRAKIQQFENDNKVRINSLYQKLKAIDTKYYQHTLHPNEEVEYIYEGEGENRKLVLNEGMLAADHEKESNELLGQIVAIEI